MELKPVGDWSRELQNTPTWRYLNASHLKRRLEDLKKAKTKKDVEKILKTPTPEQRLRRQKNTSNSSNSCSLKPTNNSSGASLRGS